MSARTLSCQKPLCTAIDICPPSIDSDGDIVLTGSSYSFGSGRYDVYVVKTNPDGEQIWAQAFGGGQDEGGFSVIETENGGYAIGGYTESFGEGESDFFLVLIDRDGNNPLFATYGGENDDVCYSLIQNEDGGFALAGYTGPGTSPSGWTVSPVPVAVVSAVSG